MSYSQEITKEHTQALEAHVNELHTALSAPADLGVAAAAVSATFTVGPKGGHLQGWITYLDGSYGKIHFKSKKITSKGGLFAGAFAFPALPVAKPDGILGQKGRTKVTGSWDSGTVSLFAGSTLVGVFPVAGAGAFGWHLDAEVDFTKG